MNEIKFEINFSFFSKAKTTKRCSGPFISKKYVCIPVVFTVFKKKENFVRSTLVLSKFSFFRTQKKKRKLCKNDPCSFKVFFFSVPRKKKLKTWKEQLFALFFFEVFVKKTSQKAQKKENTIKTTSKRTE